jgi:hypothetical protein
MRLEAILQKSWLFSGLVFLLLLLVPAQVSFAKYNLELTPGISVSEVYDDNIYLRSTNEKSDYITAVSPWLSLNVLSEKNSLVLRYAPTFVWYDDENQNDTVRHLGTLTFAQDLTKHLRFDLTDTYLKSEEPIEETEGVEGVRTTRNPYQRNTGSASLRYLFGPENALTVGYRNSILENEDVTLDDGTTQNPFGTVAYWFNVRNGLEIDYEFTDANFSRDDGSVAGDDYTGHGAGIRYLHRFTPHTTGSLGYHFTNRDFDGLTEDYEVHDGLIGFEHFFSPDFSVSLGAGYFSVKNERSDDEDGLTYDASLIKRFARGSFAIGGSGGWDEHYLEAERRGLTRYWSADTRLEYRILEPLSGYVGGSYRQDERDLDKRKWKTSRGNCGLAWAFHRWVSLSLDYTYVERDDDVDAEDYKANRVMLIVTGSRLFKW